MNPVKSAPPIQGVPRKPSMRKIRINRHEQTYNYDFVDIRCDVVHKKTKLSYEALYRYGVVFRLERYSEITMNVKMWVVEKGSVTLNKISGNDLPIVNLSIPSHIPDSQCFNWLKDSLCKEQQFSDRVVKPFANRRASSFDYYSPNKSEKVIEESIEITNFKFKVTDYSGIIGGWVDEDTEED